MSSNGELIDERGRPIALGGEIGKGGEGGVYDLRGDRARVVKLYHQKPLPGDQITKLKAMISLASDSLKVISAWPSGMVYAADSRQPCGIVMPKVAGARHLHELYGTLNRRKHFPGVGWHHMVLAARNTAAAFHTVHNTGVVVGDVNQGNLMVDSDMCVRLIDCDSFQVKLGETRFACPVGTPHFTPPELQSLQLREIERTANHDGFGLAVLIFHLLFMGRHPFAGRYLGPGEMTIEKAIAERRFAFSANKAETQVEPPPASLLLEDLPPSTAELFERAFRSDPSANELRPTAKEWAADLDQLIKQRQECEYDDNHVYYSGLKECPWCRIEDAGGPAFFVPSGDSMMVSMDRVADLNKRVQALKLPEFPELGAGQLATPLLPDMEKPEQRSPLVLADVMATTLVVAAVVAVFSVLTLWAVLGAGLLAAGAGAMLLVDKEAKLRRNTHRDFVAWLNKETAKMRKAAEKIVKDQKKQSNAFTKSCNELQEQLTEYNAEGKALVKVLVGHMDTKRDEVLRNQLLRDHVRKIKGMNPSLLAILESYGVESAYDVEKINLYGIPMVSSTVMQTLLTWREDIERGLVLRPDHGVTPQELSIATENATRRYKIAQARRVLTSASRLEATAKSARRGLEREVRGFRELGRRWVGVAKEMNEHQGERRALERRVNTSPVAILALTTIIPAAGALAWWIAG